MSDPTAPGDGAEPAPAPEQDDDEAKPRKRARKPKAPKAVPLYNKVVSVVDLPPCYAAHKYWFVYQYVPDMAFCHLCPLETFGTFGSGFRFGGRSEGSSEGGATNANPLRAGVDEGFGAPTPGSGEVDSDGEEAVQVEVEAEVGDTV